ncbi:EAL domain-containing protein [Cohnella sp. GCM10027633]|uniref:EAL domain-containing protein n=1 Tax=unclassified Cohnella TaxID=2636738 RepID=UPI00363A98F4
MNNRNGTATGDDAVPSTAPLGELHAYFQPIIALETRGIVGYETLGRHAVDGTIRSLGPFFTDAGISVAEHVRVDRLLREQALGKLSAMADPPVLFLNLKPSWIYDQYVKTGELHTLQLLQKYGVDPRRICIEITEEEFTGSMSELNQIINLYRESGCQIAIDDVGSGFSNFDRIAQIQPNLLKIDIHLMKKSAVHQGYLGAMRSFSTLAEQMGASLLVEGVETRDDLRRAIQIGARYVQGYLFSPAVPGFIAPDAFTELIEAELADHRDRLRESQAHWDEVGTALIESVRRSDIEQEMSRSPLAADRSVSADPADQADDAIRAMLGSLDESCHRVFLCTNTGIQLSSNHDRSHGGEWRVQKQYRNADWSWRPYFIPLLSRGKSRTEAMLSPRYSDLDTRKWIRTVSIPVGSEYILLIDRSDDTN